MSEPEDPAEPSQSTDTVVIPPSRLRAARRARRWPIVAGEPEAARICPLCGTPLRAHGHTTAGRP